MGLGVEDCELGFISSTPGTPENTSAATTLWQPGQPSPPWAYEYQYPVDCLRACWIIPATQTGYAGGVPITTAVTGGVPSFWLGPAVKFKVQNDQFYPVTAAAVASGGSGMPSETSSPCLWAEYLSANWRPGSAACDLSAGRVVSAVSVIAVIANSFPPLGGSFYFAIQANPVSQGSTTGSGVGATFNLTQGFRPRSGSSSATKNTPPSLFKHHRSQHHGRFVPRCLGQGPGATITMALLATRRSPMAPSTEANRMIERAR